MSHLSALQCLKARLHNIQYGSIIHKSQRQRQTTTTFVLFLVYSFFITVFIICQKLSRLSASRVFPHNICLSSPPLTCSWTFKLLFSYFEEWKCVLSWLVSSPDIAESVNDSSQAEFYSALYLADVETSSEEGLFWLWYRSAQSNIMLPNYCLLNYSIVKWPT